MAYTEADLWRTVDQLKTLGDSYNAGWDHAKRVQLATQVLKGQTNLTTIRDNVKSRQARQAGGGRAPVGGVSNNPAQQQPGAQGTAPPAVEDEFDAAGAATIRGLLESYGLGELVPMVDSWVRQGLSWPEIEVMLRDHTSEPGKVVDRLFPEIQRRRRDGKAPMSIAEIQGYRTSARELMRAEGVPAGFFDSNEDFTNLIVNDVSLAEVRDRIGEYSQFGAQIAAGAGGELDLFQRAYGVQPTTFELAALVLNPDKALPALRRQFSAVRLDVSAGRAGFGDLTGGEAERLADVGVDPGQAVAGFGALVDSKELFGRLPGQENAEDTIGRDAQLGAVFEGDANARRRIENQAKKRKNVFDSGGSFSSDRDGFGGLGRAS